MSLLGYFYILLGKEVLRRKRLGKLMHEVLQMFVEMSRKKLLVLHSRNLWNFPPTKISSLNVKGKWGT